jgi:hypothetical protein
MLLIPERLSGQGSLVLEGLTPLIEKTPKLKNEVVQAVRRIGKSPQDIECMGQRFRSEWEYLGGRRVAVEMFIDLVRVEVSCWLIGSNGR